MGFLIPRWLSSLTVTRVSSAAMKSTRSRVSAIRFEMSSRLPMGVGTRYNVPLMEIPPVSLIVVPAEAGLVPAGGSRFRPEGQPAFLTGEK